MTHRLRLSPCLLLATLLVFATSLAGCGSESRSDTTPSVVQVHIGGLTSVERVLIERDGQREIARVNRDLLEIPGVHDVTSALDGSDLEWRLVVDARHRTVWTSIAAICNQITEQRPRVVRDHAGRWHTTTHADIGFDIEPSPLVRTLVFEPTRTANVSLTAIARSLAEVPGVRFAHASGARFERTTVETGPDRLDAYGLTVDEIDGAVRRALGLRLDLEDLEAFVVRTHEDHLIRLGDVCRAHHEFVDSAHVHRQSPIGVVQVVHTTDTDWDQVLQRAVELGTTERLLVHWLRPTEAEREKADATRIDSFERTVWIDLGGADDLTLAREAQGIAQAVNDLPAVYVWPQSVPKIHNELDLQLNDAGRSLGLTPRDLPSILFQDEHGQLLPFDSIRVRTPDGASVPLTSVTKATETEVARPRVNVGRNAVVRILVRLEGQEDREAQLESIRDAVDALPLPSTVRVAVRALASESF